MSDLISRCELFNRLAPVQTLGEAYGIIQGMDTVDAVPVQRKGGAMDDMISRQAALDALGERPVVWTDKIYYILGARNQYDMDRLAIETVPSAQLAQDLPKGCTDTISRSAAVETMRKAKDKSEAHRMLVQLPSAQQIPWDANTRNSMVFTLRTVLNGGDMDAIDEDNIKRLSRWLEGGEP